MKLTTLVSDRSSLSASGCRAPVGGVAHFSTIRFRRLLAPAVYGAVFLLAGAFARSQTFKVLHPFTGVGDGRVPQGALVQESNGLLYGTTYSGGTSNAGTIYEVRPDGAGYAVLHNFTANNDNATDSDGGFPYAGLTVGPGGVLFGTTSSGGTNLAGVVFEIHADGTGYSPIHFLGTKTTVTFSLTNGFTYTYEYDAGVVDGRLLLGADGRLYGAGSTGGATALWGGGALFALNQDGSEESLLTSFKYPDPVLGYSPEAGLVQATDGALYGVNDSGGTNSAGTLFRVNTDGSGFTVLHTFAADDGIFPQAELLQGPDGALYGTTSGGGGMVPGSSTAYNGTVFKLDPDGGNFAVIHKFAGGGFPLNGADGTMPVGGLTLAGDGALYGVTRMGGASNLGCIYKLNPDGRGFGIVHSFTGQADDGAFPSGSLFLGSDGALYGVAREAGTNQNTGILFKLVIGSLPTLAITTPTTSGSCTSTTPSITVSGTAANVALVGWANSLGQSGLATGTTDWSVASLPLQNGTNVITVTAYDGKGNQQSATLTVYFSYAPPPTLLNIIHTFGQVSSDGSGPSGLSFGADGVLYGTTGGGGTGGGGTIFKLAADGSGYSVLQNFPLSTNSLLNDVFNDGMAPAGGVIEAEDGELYGATGDGGEVAMTDLFGYGGGTIFRINPGGGLRTQYDFPDDASGGGMTPSSGIILGSDGRLYGLAYSGGASNVGVVFTINRDGTGYSVLHSFGTFPAHDGIPGFGDPARSMAPPGDALIQGLDGSLYGVMRYGGIYGFGTCFRINTDGSHYEILHNFALVTDLNVPTGGLIQGSDGTLYGVTFAGGPKGEGGIYRINPDGSGYSVLRYFGIMPNDGSYPNPGLARGPDGAVYGTTRTGGANDRGVLFRMEANGAAYAVIHNFSDADGGEPFFPLVFGTDGALYGATAGSIYKVLLSAKPSLVIDSPAIASPFVTTTGDTVSLTGSAVALTNLTEVTWSSSTGASGTASGTTNWSINELSLQPGTNTLIVTATDAANQSQTALFTVVYVPTDTMPPVVAITSPTSAPVYASAGNSLDLSGTALDNVGVTQITWSNNRGGSGAATPTPFWTVRGIPVQVGTNALTVTASDAANNQASATLTVIYTPPTIQITTPTSGGLFTTANPLIDLGGAASGGYGGVLAVTWVNDANGSLATASGTTSWSAQAIPLVTGTNVITATAWDTAGNQQSASVTVLCTWAPAPVQVDFSAIYTFTGNSGIMPLAGLQQGADGMLYGAAVLGGPSFDPNNPASNLGAGVVFEINTNGVGMTVLHDFSTNPPAQPPQGPEAIVLGGDGSLYGVSVWSSTNSVAGGFVGIGSGNGAVFRLNADGTAFSTLVDGIGGGANINGLIQGSDGVLYGVSPDWGLNADNLADVRCGAVFKVNTNGTDFVILRSFDPQHTPGDAYHPQNVIEGQDGRLYGVAACGGTNNSFGGGVVFALNKDGSDYTVLHTFDHRFLNGASPAGQLALGEVISDGYSAMGPVTQGPDGTLYGATQAGGRFDLEGSFFAYGGTVYMLRPDGSGYRVLHSFGGPQDWEEYPYGKLVFGKDGALYGTCYSGTQNGGGSGAIFRINPDGTEFAVLHSFASGDGSGNGLVSNPDGAEPYAGLSLGQDGAFYGTASEGGASGYGTIFKLTVSPGPFISGIQLGPSGAALSLNGVPGLDYQVQAATRLANNSWATIGSVTMTTKGTAPFADTNAASFAARFYRMMR
jgi:uncharacterized repeat protein (TIGR03803 family)